MPRVNCKHFLNCCARRDPDTNDRIGWMVNCDLFGNEQEMGYDCGKRCCDAWTLPEKQIHLQMNIESLIVNVCLLRNSKAKDFKDLSLKDTSRMSLDEKQENLKKMLVIHGAIMAYDTVLALCKDCCQEEGEE